MELSIISKYFTKPLETFGEFALKPLAAVACVPVMIPPAMSTPIKALILLAIFFILDFLTGIGASYVEFKKSLPVLPGSGKRYVLSSSKMRLSVVKFITYGLAALIARGMEWVFIPGEFEPNENLNKMTLTTIVIGICCVIEVYSILFENVKRMGFDLIQKVKQIYKEGWKLYKYVKNGKDESTESN